MANSANKLRSWQQALTRWGKEKRHQGEYQLLKTAQTLLPWLPRQLLLELAAALAEAAFLADKHGRKTALENLALSFPHESKSWHKQTARQSYHSLSRTILDLFWMAKHLRADSLDHFVELHWHPAAQAAAAKQSAIFITPHYGNFEISAALWGHLGNPALVIAQDFKNPRLTPLFQELRSRAGHHIIDRKGALLKVLRHLNRGGHVAFLADLGVPPQQAAVPIEVFGRWISAPAMPAILAQRTGLPILPALSTPLEDGRSHVEVLNPIHAEEGESLQALSQRAWDAFAPALEETPQHWLWAYKHWRYLPADEYFDAQPELDYPSYANPSKSFEKLLREHCPSHLEI